MNIKYLFFSFFILFSSLLKSQSFNEEFRAQSNQIPYIFNEYNIYSNINGSIIFFNSNKNPNNSSGYSDLNDIWIRLKNDNIWGNPINLSQINTNGNDLLLGVDESFIYVLRNNYVFTYSVIEPYELISELEIIGLDKEYEIISGSIDSNNNIIFLSIQGYGSFGVEDIYYSKKLSDRWSRLVNCGSSLNSNYQEISPYLLNTDTLLFISNRNNNGYKLFYSVKDNESLESWTEPKVLEKLNSNSSKLSISRNQKSSTFYISESSDSKTYYDLIEYKVVDLENSFVLEINIKPEIKSGLLTLSTNKFNISERLSSSNALIELENKGQYNLRLISNNYFILDTILNIQKSSSVNLNLLEIKKGNRKTLSQINFKRSSTELTEQSIPYLENLLHIFKENDVKVIIEGHTDNSGDYKLNVKLSKDRANTIKGYLIKNGIERNRIKIKGYGPSKPRYSNQSEELRRLNRRVELYIN
ncbi:MAG: hypothetical protein CMB86_00560 [Flammeovirgaceae bacterium]|nr:hypothetical protein [Flammeovirgaceae bacterium]